MNGNELLSRLRHLSEIEDPRKDIHGLTYAQFPGTHCPLMGAAMAIQGIDDAVMMIVGTDECAYYTKDMTINSDEWGGPEGRCVSVTIDQHDITFGCIQKLREAFNELIRERSPQAVFIVSTCVPEIIGDDFDSEAQALSCEYGIPVMAVHTEHFKCTNHMPGIERTITACFELMEDSTPDGSVNIIGQRMGKFENTELFGVLSDAGVTVRLKLPSGCTVSDIRMAPRASVNILVNDIGLPLARKMKQRFGIPYVFFDKFVDPERTFSAYSSLFEFLGKQLPEKVKTMKQEAIDIAEKSREVLDGIPFIYGNTPFRCMETCAYLASLGMIPQLIQCHGITEADGADVERILRYADPYMTQVANISPLQHIYDVLHPMLYLGHEYPMRLRKKGIAQALTDRGGSMHGFEVTKYAVEQLTAAAKEAAAMKNGGPDR